MKTWQNRDNVTTVNPTAGGDTGTVRVLSVKNNWFIFISGSQANKIEIEFDDTN